MSNHALECEVRLDLQKAADALWLSRDQRTWISALYRDAMASDLEVARDLGLVDETIRIASGRSLRADRLLGAMLRSRLRHYKNNFLECVREIVDSCEDEISDQNIYG